MISEPVTPGDIAIAETNVSVVVNDAESYTLRLSVDSATITNGSGNSGSSTSDSNNTLIAGNPNDSNSTNVWGYKWDEASTYTAPTTTGTVLTSSTNPSSTETGLNSNGTTSFTKTLTFGAKFSEQANAGTYHGSGTLSLVATPRATVRTLTYNLNGGNISGSTTNPTQTCSDYGTGCNITMSYTDPTRSGYDFLGWADGSTATSADTTNYGNGKVVTMSASTTSKIIYAVWVEQGPIVTGFGGIKKMQDMTSTICDNVTQGATGQLYDTRDNNVYGVYKAKDNKCWMTDNLKIMGDRILTSADSDVNSDWALPASQKNNFTSNNSAQAAFLYNSNGFYSWCAATAGTCANAITDGAQAKSSICPKGWKLPSGGLYGEYDNFASSEGIADSTDGSAKIQGAPYNFKAPSFIITNGSVELSSYFAWWTRTANGDENAYYLYLNKYNVRPGTSISSRYNGYSVRCMAKFVSTGIPDDF